MCNVCASMPPRLHEPRERGTSTRSGRCTSSSPKPLRGQSAASVLSKPQSRRTRCLPRHMYRIAAQSGWPLISGRALPIKWKFRKFRRIPQLPQFPLQEQDTPLPSGSDEDPDFGLAPVLSTVARCRSNTCRPKTFVNKSAGFRSVGMCFTFTTPAPRSSRILNTLRST